MCTGAEAALLAASAAATAGGTAASISARKKSRQAMERAAALDTQRKEKISKESQGLFNSETDNSNAEKASSDADAAAAEQLAAAKGLVNREDTGFSSATEAPGLAQSASPVVKETAARTLADELGKAEGQMKARAVLQGWTQRQNQRANQFGRTGEQMMLLGNFSKGWDQVQQIEQAQAAHAGDNRAMLGDVLTGLGHIGLSAVGSGALGGLGGAGAGSQYALSGAKLGEMAPVGALRLGEAAATPTSQFALSGARFF